MLRRFCAMCLTLGLGEVPAFAQSIECRPRGAWFVFGVNATWQLQLKAGTPCASTIPLPNGNLQSATLSRPAQHGAASVNGATYGYIPNRGFIGSDRFQMTLVGAGAYGSGVSVVTVNVLVKP